MPRKKTHEEFVKEVYDLVGSEYEVLGKYINADTKIKMKHKECDYTYMTSPSNFLNGKRCPECAKKIVSEKRTKSHEQFKNEVIEIYGEIYEFLTEYESANDKIKIKHKECNYEWDILPYSLLNKKKKGSVICPNCNGGIKHTHEYIEKIIYELTKGEYVIIETYINYFTPIKIKHNVENCQHVFEASPANFITKGSRCPKCSGYYRLTHDDFINTVFELVGDEYTVMSEYTKNSIEITMKHNMCSSIYQVTPAGFKNGSRCPYCHKGKINTEIFKKKVFDHVEDEYIVLGEYVNIHTPLLFKHNTDKCKQEFIKTPNEFLYVESRCPCSNKKSKAEILIYDILNKNKLIFKKQYSIKECNYNKKLRFDFAIFNKQNTLICLIEYDGIQHFNPVDFAGKGEKWAVEQFEINKQKDQIKNNYCKENNIKLYRIPYWYFDNIEEILDKIIHNQPLEVSSTSFLIVNF